MTTRGFIYRLPAPSSAATAECSRDIGSERTARCTERSLVKRESGFTRAVEDERLATAPSSSTRRKLSSTPDNLYTVPE
jgi:hypothetical protein